MELTVREIKTYISATKGRSPNTSLLQKKRSKQSFPKMSSPKESKDQKPSSSEQQPPGENSPRNTPSAQERTGQNDSNVTQHDKGEEGDNNVKKSEGGNQVKTGQIKTNATGTGGDAEAETKGSGGDNVKGRGDGGGGDLKNEKNASQTGKGQVSGASATGGGTSASTKKRGRQGDPSHVGASRGSESKMKVEVPSCGICKKSFPSWKGVFGHLRAHPKPTFMTFPPPTCTPESSPEKNKNNDNNKVEKTVEEQLAPTLLSLACQTLQTISQDSNATDSTGVASASRRGLAIDLNEPRTNVLLDTPPPEKEEDDDGDHQN